jgi:PadR family transcriptional regulator PadR
VILRLEADRMPVHRELYLPGQYDTRTHFVKTSPGPRSCWLAKRAHGWGIGERIQQLSRDAIRVNQGTLYPVLERLQQRGWIVGEWRASENNRRAKYYVLTRAGARRLADEEHDWERSIRAIQLIMRTAE